MDLPDKKCIRVEFHYENGDKIFIEGEQLQFFEQNLKASGSFCSMHSFQFLPISWSEAIDKKKK